MPDLFPKYGGQFRYPGLRTPQRFFPCLNELRLLIPLLHLPGTGFGLINSDQLQARLSHVRRTMECAFLYRTMQTVIRLTNQVRPARGGALEHRARAGHAPGIFFDPCPTGDLLGAALSATIWTSSRPRTPYFVILWALLLFDNGYFDASFTFGIWYICILIQFHRFSSIFCSFPPHPLLTRLISPHHGDPKKAG